MSRQTIALLTDFGTQSNYAGILKGVIWGINPQANIADLTHDISPHNLTEAAFVLEHSYRYFPRRTIFVVVVDPGVGSARRPLLAVGDHAFYVAPDNGVLTSVLESDDVTSIYELTEEHYFRQPVSHTFHGRDIFSPTAAWLSTGVESRNFGDPVEDPVRIELPAPRAEGNRVMGQVMHIDRFGNLISNISRRLIHHLMEKYKLSGFTVQVGQLASVSHVESFSQVAPGAAASLFGSTDQLELIVREGSAAASAGVAIGADLVVEFRR